MTLLALTLFHFLKVIKKINFIFVYWIFDGSKHIFVYWVFDGSKHLNGEKVAFYSITNDFQTSHKKGLFLAIA